MRQAKRDGMVKGKPLNHSVAIEQRYIAELMRMVNQMVKQTHREVMKCVKPVEIVAMDAKEKTVKQLEKEAAAKKEEAVEAAKLVAAQKAEAVLDRMKKNFDAMFQRKAKDASSAMLGAVSKESAVNLASSLKDLSGGVTLNMDFMDKTVSKAIREQLLENIAKVKSIPNDYAERARKVLLHSAETGGDMTGLADRLQKIGDMSKRQAKNLALDQTRKAYNTINAVRMKQVGVKQFEWVHSGGGIRPRESHIAMYPAGLNGGIFNMDEGAYDPDAEMWIMPAELPNCRCTMVPVHEFDEGEFADIDF